MAAVEAGAVRMRSVASATDAIVDAAERARRDVALRLFQLAIALPILVWIIGEAVRTPEAFASPTLLMWIAAIAVVDLLPAPTFSTSAFSLSFPLQLAVAIIYPPSAAAAVAFLGTSDPRQLPLTKVLFMRAHVGASVIAASVLFRSVAEVGTSAWPRLLIGVVLSTAAAYAINVVLSGLQTSIETGTPPLRVLRRMHVGLVGEFLVSYAGLALFGVIVAIFFVRVGAWSILAFIAPMTFARQMFRRTQSLERATQELERRQREKEWEATHDALTSLPNRTLFLQRLRHATAVAKDAEVMTAVLIMDLNHFKEINDTLGHDVGDRVLTEVGPRLQDVFRDGDVVARLGGDEFAVVLRAVPDEQTVVRVAQRVLASLDQPINVDGLSLHISGSIGIALFPEHSEDVDTLLRRAEVAMYSAKEQHIGFQVYRAELDPHSATRLQLLNQIKPAIEREEFVLHYQPKAELSDGEVRGVEALVRWQHPYRGLIPPDEFIPIAERTTLFKPLTLHVIDQALRQCHAWRATGRELQVAINLSPRNLLDEQLPDQIAQMLYRWHLRPSSLRIEITEHTLMTDARAAMDVLARLSAIGIQLSIDDFGTGYSSLSYLKRLPVDEIKIDRSFVMNMSSETSDETIVRATIDLAHHLGLRVVAEGVEDERTWNRLREMGCDSAQGYFLSRPLPGLAVSGWLDDRARGAAEAAGSRSVPLRLASARPE